MDYIIPLLFILAYAYFVKYHRSEEVIDEQYHKFEQYLISNNDENTLNDVKKQLFNADRARILVNRFYETKDTNYLAFAIQNFVINSYLIILICGILLFFSIIYIITIKWLTLNVWYDF